ncbi:hypothetical protein RIF23_11580 [Lipingzhangella sp. LS1_29]|uniref:Uncharacterized protein n=1 Tax=Lipingzhangella rawalii TaxID=2055835 RepID=A0ABU2H7W8_9ACTN|nr:hypothetical protein [Lipingzhangella rawalii]MDS1270939.1 hypothetical protein [Lipingzhangella rawalii]
MLPSIRSDRGGVLVEYVAGLVLVAGILAAISFSALYSGANEDVEDHLCHALRSEGCEGQAAGTHDYPDYPEFTENPERQLDLLCPVSGISWDGAFGVHVPIKKFPVRGENTAGDVLDLYENPYTGEETAMYSTRGGHGLGAGAQHQTSATALQGMVDGSMSFEAFLNAGAGLQFNYEFTGDNAHERAQQERSLRRDGWVQRAAAVGSGMAGEAVEAGVLTALRYGDELWEWIKDKTPGVEGNPDEVAEKWDGRTPSSATVDIVVEGDLGGEIGGGASVSDEDEYEELEGTAGAEAQLELALKNAVTVDGDWNRTHEMMFEVDGNVRTEAGMDYSGFIPAGMQAEIAAAGGAMLGQRMQFDDDGNPTLFELDLMYEYEASAGIDIEIGEEEIVDWSAPLHGDVDDGTWVRVEETKSLDLTNDANREAIEELFILNGGVMAIPNPTALVDSSRIEGYAERFAESGYETRWLYEAEKEEIQDQFLGSRKAQLGVGWHSREETWELISGQVMDHSHQQPEWQQLQC